jgi:hypothetical protein
MESVVNKLICIFIGLSGLLVTSLVSLLNRKRLGFLSDNNLLTTLCCGLIFSTFLLYGVFS